MRFRSVLGLAVAVTLSACSTQLIKFGTNRPAMIQTTLRDAGIGDERTRFRTLFCKLVERDLSGVDAACDQWLTRLSDESNDAPAVQPVAPPAGPAVDVVLVTGIFGECLGQKTEMFGDGIDALHRKGYRVSRAPVRGRGGSEFNARIIRDHIVQQRSAVPRRPIIIVSYSKGTSDTMTALADYPELIPDVAAVISIAGVVNGSPLADSFDGLYSATVGKLPYADCPKIDHREMTSISRHQRFGWLAQRALPEGPAYFSIAGVPHPDRVSLLLRHFYTRLSDIDPLNDGQVLFYDAILPRSSLLAYVNADHWSIALPFEISSPVLAATLLDKNHFPRAQMLEAAVEIAQAHVLEKARR